MRNLRTIAYRETQLPQGLPLTATAWDTATDAIICAFGPTATQPVIELKRRVDTSSCHGEFVTITSWDSPCPLPYLECDQILHLQYFSDIATCCLVLAGGDVVVVREDPNPDQEKIEIVGTVDVGICAAAWAPDEELLAIVTRADTLVLMSRTFELLNEGTLSPEDLKVSKHVSVGWGHKETQFQGRRAKAMRDPTMPEKVDEGKPSPYEDSKVTVSWRGDGQFLAINSVVPNHRRVIRVFTREAVLDSASEPVDGMESALSWKPSGNLIASVKRSEDRIEIIFFERNGLRHGQFDLRMTKEQMRDWASSISLLWNTDSTVLAVAFKDRVQFWTMGNYHYYLKQEFLFHSPSSNSPLRWHPETPLRTTCGDTKRLLDITFLSAVSRGGLIPPQDHGIVGVIDGRTLKLTPFKQAGVPPPMAFCEVLFGHNIIDCAISQDGQRIAVLTTDTLELCQWKTRANSKGDLIFMTTVERYSCQLPSLKTQSDPLYHTQVTIRGDEIFVVAPMQSRTTASCWKLKWHERSCSAWEQVPAPDCSESLITDSFSKSIFATDPCENATVPLSGCPKIKLSGSQPNSSIFTLHNDESFQLNDEMNGHAPEYHKVSLSLKGNLYIDDTLLVREVTSYILTSTHLIFTTSSHLLKFVHITHPSAMQIPNDTPEIDERCRNIERGARIVTAIPSIYAVVLQMPRGNLETVYPRLLVLSGIRRHLKQEDYLAAFLACQTHQVDMNILYDYDPDTFLSNVPKFIDQLRTPSRVDGFLSKLRDEDVTQTLYRDTTLQPQFDPQARSLSNPKPTFVLGSKINKIANTFLSILSSKPSSYLQTIITAHVCKRPPDLTSALKLVSTLLQTSKEEADVAISHLFFLTPNPSLLFDAALSLYDLGLTLLVAQNDNSRDPREYMPYLQSLQELPELRCRYAIDDHLKKHSKALVSLHAMGEHEEAVIYTAKHSLYTTAMELYKYNQVHLTEITRMYAEYLTTQKSHHAEAATLYESLRDYDAAYKLYALAHKWREALTCATLVPLAAAQVQSLAQSMATTLMDENRDYRAAATIHIDYLSNIPEAAKLLCRGSYFAEAMRVLALDNHPVSEIHQIIDAGLGEKVGEILELLADCRAQLTAQVPRIAELRKKKEEDPLAFFGGDPTTITADGSGAAVGDNIPDNISLAPTDASTLGGQSLFTRYGSNASKFGGTVASNVSRKTSKTKRREERKRARGKKGSVYEEEYLVASVGRLIHRVNGLHDEVGRLIAGLLRRGMRERARQVDENMKEICQACERAREDVWEVERKDEKDGQEESTYDKDGQGRPPGAEGVFWDSQQESQKKREAPEVKGWISSEPLAS
ncbi:uncharacterized protein Z519_03938 [Cladophialophora bantiana CBS 173.52]|uniref:Elongator complex protein 1 n=1 Tax=Cladophialophora bantiana (strain ATCC 10958 / CBS 173.52 / CDC B-1940 / NIH 8579) TaxID=1442370 RepID=A0A0D2IEZ8_CLAB1|nr:uncharacterized protein Z519_03938 [Cladophialophora bantiana CBS 173.52]KIW95354.1 hypothetical protein Z519_03938 [Cladophialophora bantiana CBS 173.52]